MTGFRGKDIVLVQDANGVYIPIPIRECVVITDTGSRRDPQYESYSEGIRRREAGAIFYYPSPVHEEKEMGHLSNLQVLFSVSRKSWWGCAECFSGFRSGRYQSGQENKGLKSSKISARFGITRVYRVPPGSRCTFFSRTESFCSSCSY